MLFPDRILIPASEIARRVAELGNEIRSHGTKEPIVLLGLMNGALFFLADLLRQLPPEAELQCSTISSYVGTQSSGRIRGLETISQNLKGRRVLVVDDILDSGLTLFTVTERLLELGATEVDCCVLLSKKVERVASVQPKWVGFEIENEFVVGYGLDYNGKYRSLPDIRILQTKNL